MSSAPKRMNASGMSSGHSLLCCLFASILALAGFLLLGGCDSAEDNTVYEQIDGDWAVVDFEVNNSERSLRTQYPEGVQISFNIEGAGETFSIEAYGNGGVTQTLCRFGSVNVDASDSEISFDYTDQARACIEPEGVGNVFDAEYEVLEEENGRAVRMEIEASNTGDAFVLVNSFLNARRFINVEIDQASITIAR